MQRGLQVGENDMKRFMQIFISVIGLYTVLSIIVFIDFILHITKIIKPGNTYLDFPVVLNAPFLYLSMIVVIIDLILYVLMGKMQFYGLRRITLYILIYFAYYYSTIILLVQLIGDGV